MTSDLLLIFNSSWKPPVRVWLYFEATFFFLLLVKFPDANDVSKSKKKQGRQKCFPNKTL